jgi:hypothetical protein
MDYNLYNCVVFSSALLIVIYMYVTGGRAYLCTGGYVNYCHCQSTIMFQRSVIYMCKIISECTKENMEKIMKIWMNTMHSYHFLCVCVRDN